jgi:hypothetical protein
VARERRGDEPRADPHLRGPPAAAGLLHRPRRPRGFTSRGQPLGAAVGPGSQSQWAALDYVAPRWQAGLFAQRVRHQNDALYRVEVANPYRTTSPSPAARAPEAATAASTRARRSP